MRVRYCQRCGAMQKLHDAETPRPCHTCGGVNFDLQPKLHTLPRGYELIDWVRPTGAIQSDQDFLRVQGIDPED